MASKNAENAKAGNASLGRIRVIVWERWWTADTEHTCARCRALNGRLLRRGEGPVPPLHPNCHCQRRHERIEIVREEER